MSANLLNREQLPQNSQPLNQIARRYLRLAKIDPDPTQLYLLQLLAWGLNNPKLKTPSPDWRDQFQQALENLQGSEPDHAMSYLTTNPDDRESPFLTPRQLRKAMSPLEAVRVTVNALDLKLAADPNADDYPPSKYRRN